MTYIILVVDDEQTLAETLANILEYFGYGVLVALDGEAALEVLKLNQIDLIISDYMMPKLDGKELYRKISADHRTANIPMIMMSALPEKLTDLPAYAILKKPFGMDEMLEKVVAALEKTH